jgi:uncharacterized membrane protein YhhN
MKRTPASLLPVLFWIIAALDVFAVTVNIPLLHLAMKPLLMPVLLLQLFLFHTASTGKTLMLAGLFFSFAGDVFLLFESNSPLYFMFGLGSFLLTHIFYSIYFFNIQSPLPSLLRKQPWVAALILAFTVSLVNFLGPYLHDLKIPVVIYAIVISIMMLGSFHVFLKINSPANILLVVGALVFAASDTMLAVNKFYKPFSGAGALIMLSYCLAQFCIVQGVMKRK